jgi:hypothetical protein
MQGAYRRNASQIRPFHAMERRAADRHATGARRNLMKTALAAVLALAASAAADPLPKQVQNMERLVGTWKGTGSLAMGKDKAKLGFTFACKRTSAKFGVLCSLEITGVPSMAGYAETDLFGYEPNSDTYHWYSVTSAGETHDHVAKASDGSKIQYVYTGTQEGKPLKEVIDMELGKDTISVRSETFIAGASVAVLEGKGTK